MSKIKTYLDLKLTNFFERAFRKNKEQILQKIVSASSYNYLMQHLSGGLALPYNTWSISPQGMMVIINHILINNVKTIVEFGAFVEIMPNCDGLLHVSEIAHERVNNVNDYLKEGDKLVEIVPTKIEYAVEMFVRPVDMPLMNKGQKVRFLFDGFLLGYQCLWCQNLPSHPMHFLINFQ
jgi:hypothetical protein